MLLDYLKDFSWYNEPANVRFNEQGMVVDVQPKSEFWQHVGQNIHRDNGHLFYSRCLQNFSLSLKWRWEEALAFDQCGIMVRVDNLNWFKLGVVVENSQKMQLGSCLTLNGYSDWGNLEINPQAEIWFRLKRNGNDYMAAYSMDGITYKPIRLFHLEAPGNEVKAGAYVASPQRSGFTAILEQLEIR